MIKIYIDAKSSLKPAQGHSQRAQDRMLRPKRPDVIPFLSESCRESLNEILDDLSFLSDRNNLDPVDLLEAFVHFWKQETIRKPRLQIARRLHAARRFGYRRMKDKQREKEQSLEEVADRLIEALAKST